VKNPEGDGIPAVSSTVTAARLKHALRHQNSSGDNPPVDPVIRDGAPHNNHHHGGVAEDHDTKVKDDGSARRNITRKTNPVETPASYDSSHKRQGGAGKGKWIQTLDGSDTLPIATLDKNDPLYDEYTMEGAVLTSTEGGDNGYVGNGDKHYDPVAEKFVYGPMLTLCEFKIRLKEALQEYFDSGDVPEFVECLTELKCAEYHSEIIKKSISLSLDKTSRERELVSRFLCELHPKVLTDKDVTDGFLHLLEDTDDLTIDAPDAKSVVGTFLARAVVDEVLPPAFLSNRRGEAIENAMRLLSMEHCGARLERAWGPGDGRPVPDIKVAMDQLLKEYLLGRELDEAARCIRELNCPHYHHELVKRGATVAMEELHDKNSAAPGASSNEDDLDAMAALFMFLVENAIVNESQIHKGLQRLQDRLEDLKLDVSPKAPELLQDFKEMLSAHGFQLNNNGDASGAAEVEA
jgi:programmed cell death protein 4